MSYLDSLTQKRQEAWHRAKEIMDRAAAESRDLTPEENQNLADTDTAIDAYVAEEKRIVDLERKMQAADALHTALAPALAAGRAEKREPTDADNLVALFRNEIRGFDSPLTIPVGHEARALASSGGSAIATTFADFVTVYERTMNPMLDISTVIPTRTGNPIVFPRLTADVTAGGSVTAEAGTLTEGDPTISSITLTAFKMAHITLWSSELDQDEVIGLDRLVADAISRPMALGWGTFFTTGTGTTQPNGFITAATNGGTAGGTASGQASDTFLAAADLVDLYYSLAAPYRRNASWVVSNTAIAKMRKFRSSTGEFLWNPALQAGQPASFLNLPVYENPAMAAVASASKSVAVGDFSRYIIRSVEPMRVDLSTEYKYNTDQVAIRVITRRDGNLPDAIAIKYLVSANT